MITINEALSIYTDKLNKNENIDIEFFKENLTNEDYIEFSNSINSINLCKSLSLTEKFNKLFTKINAHKKNIYSIDTVANFRSNNDSSEKEFDTANEIVDKLFDEEFDDE